MIKLNNTIDSLLLSNGFCFHRPKAGRISRGCRTYPASNPFFPSRRDIWK